MYVEKAFTRYKNGNSFCILVTTHPTVFFFLSMRKQTLNSFHTKSVQSQNRKLKMAYHQPRKLTSLIVLLINLIGKNFVHHFFWANTEKSEKITFFLEGVCSLNLGVHSKKNRRYVRNYCI